MPLTPEAAVRTPRRRPQKNHRAGVIVFAFVAAFGFLLVNVVDPYSGAAASTKFHFVNERFGDQQTQELIVAGSYKQTVSRDAILMGELPPPPPPPPPPAPAEESDGSDDGGFSPPPDAAVPDPGSAKAYAKSALTARGFGSDEFSCLVALWNRESGWRVNAYNASSGAYGIPQALPGGKMASAGPDWKTNAHTQVDWGLGYVIGRYGSPCGAWGHSESAGWY